jgi:glycolate oxidase iron-sulfur subunit
MQTELHEAVAGTREGARAEQILRSCVHCGFCNATCPTYLLTGDELDGPRGRIYLIKDMLETGNANGVVQRHLDRCLTCRACETTCPSGVQYGELLELGRGFMESRQPRSILQSVIRRWLNAVVPKPAVFRRLLQGCVQRVATPNVNDALISLLNKQGISVILSPNEVCCGSLNLHLGEHEQAMLQVRRNVDSLVGLLDEHPDVEAVLSTASGCGVTYKDYARLLEADPEYAAKAAGLLSKVHDVAEFVAVEGLRCEKTAGVETVAWHPPCTLQHGQKITGLVEGILERAGYRLLEVNDAHLCCGSAGTYSLLQPALSHALRDNKLQALQAPEPDAIATANVGCQTHLAAASRVPVMHWLELVR